MTMAVFILIAAIIDGLVVWGLFRSHDQRGADWRHYAAFVGFTAAVIAVTATTVGLVVGAPHTRPSPVIMGFLAIISLLSMTSILATIVAGLCSRGMQRLALVSCGLATALTLLLGMVGHFGD